MNDAEFDQKPVDEDRLEQSSESGLRVEPGVFGSGEGGSSGPGYDRGEGEDRAPTEQDSGASPGIREGDDASVVEVELPQLLRVPDGEVNEAEFRSGIQRLVAVVDQVVGNTEQKIRDDLRRVADEARTACDFCESCIRGCPGRTCDRVDEIINKCDTKIIRSLREHIGESYYYTFNLFGPPPTIEEIMGGPSTQATPEPPTTFNQASVLPPVNCPPGTKPQWSPEEQRWICVAECPPGTTLDPVSGHCFPPDEPIPPSQPSCPVEKPPAGAPDPIKLPPTQPPEPPCPPPTDIICPPGMSWQWLDNKWKCAPLPSKPGEPPETEIGGSVCLAEGKAEVCLTGVGADSNPVLKAIQELLDVLIQNWNSPEVCRVLDQIKLGRGAKLTQIIPWNYDPIRKGWNVPPIVLGAISGLPSLVGKAVLGTVGSLIAAADSVLEILPKIAGCDLSAISHHLLLGTLLDLAEQYLGIKVPAIRQSIQYSTNYHCPSLLPDQQGINQLFYSGAITEGQWKCLTRAIGNLDHWQRLLRTIQQPDLTPDQLATAYWRKLIDKDELVRRLTERYGLPQDVASNYDKLTATLPGIGDVVRFMVRDVADPKVVEKYQYDAEFLEKWNGKLRDFTQALGLDEEVMRYFWRAHWELPSPTQLYEMLRRLRADSVDPKARALSLTERDVADALAANDIPKFWRDRLIAISYLPMTITDAKQAYIDGAIDENTLRSIIRDNGRNEFHTQLIIDMVNRQKARRTQRLIGSFTPDKVTKWLKNGVVDEAKARRLYIDAGLTESQADHAIKMAKEALKNERLEKRVRMIEKRYAVGDLLKDQAINLLNKVGVDLAKAEQMVEEWEFEIQVRSKQVTAAMMCSWFYRGLISVDEFAVRLRRIGYQDADVVRIIAECQASAAERTFDRKVKNIRGQKVLKDAMKPKEPK